MKRKPASKMNSAKGHLSKLVQLQIEELEDRSLPSLMPISLPTGDTVAEPQVYLNDLGQVAGSSGTGYKSQGFQPVLISPQAFIWSVKGGGTSVISTGKYVFGLNSQGQVLIGNSVADPTTLTLWNSDTDTSLSVALPSGDTEAGLLHLNNQGQVAGTAYDVSNTGTLLSEQSFIWSAATGTKNLPAGDYVLGLNDEGQVLTEKFDSATQEEVYSLWDSSTGTASTITLPTGETGVLGGLLLNNQGQVAGVADTVNVNGQTETEEAFIWSAAAGTTVIPNAISVVALNNEGVVLVQNPNNAQNDEEYALWNSATGTSLSIALPTGDTQAGQLNLNDEGQVAGTAYSVSESAQSFTWSESTGAQVIATGDYVLGFNNNDQVLLGNSTYIPTSLSVWSPDHLVITTQPSSNVLTNSKFDVQVSVEDPLNNVDTDFTGSVNIQLANDPNGNSTLGGTTTLNVTDGIADFNNLTINKVGQGFTLEATSSGQTAVTTTSFVVFDQLVVTTQPPSSVQSGVDFDVTVSAEDGNGNVDPNFNGSVNIQLGNDPNGDSTLGGTPTLTATNGVADFNNLTINKVGQGFTLQTTSSGQTSATTNPFQVVPGPASPATSTVTLSIGSIQLGGQTTVTLQAKDANGNDETSGGLTVAFGLESGTGGQGTFTSVTDNGDGTYTATFTGTADGINTITATINGSTVTTTLPNIDITGSAYSLSNSYVTVQPGSVQSGSTSTITLHVEDASGNNETSGGLTVTFALGSDGGGQGTISSVTDNDNGTYTATFTATIAGSNTIVATIDGSTVTSTAPSITVTPGPVSLANSYVTVSPGSIESGDTATITLQAEDAEGNKETTGGLTVLFSLGNGSGQGTFSSVTDNGNGTYTATFTGTVEGTNTITATINDSTVTSTAPSITVTPGSFSLANSIVTVSPGSIQSGGTTTVTLQAKDANGNDLTTGGLTVLFGLGSTSGSSGTFSSVADNGNGTYTATFTGVLAGGNTLTATINGSAVTSTPPTIVVTPGPVSLAKSTISLSLGSVQFGGVTTITLQAKDANGNDETSGGLSVAFALGSGTGGKGTISSVRDNGNGTYTATFTGTVDGNNTITATINGSPVTTAAPSISVTGTAVSVARSTLKVLSPTIQSGNSTTITLQAVNAQGVKETSGGLTVAFRLASATGALGTFGPVIDNDNGTYTVTFTGTIAGTNTIRATIDGVAVTTPPPAIKVIPGAVSLAKSTVLVTANSLRSGSVITVAVVARDAAGNRETTGGLSVLFTLANPSGDQGTFSAVTDHKNGAYTATFTGAIVGTNTIVATIGGQVVTTAMPSITVVPGPVSLAKSYITVSSASVGSGSTVTVTLQAEDAHGNLETTGGLKVLFAIGAASVGRGVFSAVTDHKNGTYTATFTGTIAGNVIIRASMNGLAVISTPPTVTVTPGPINLAKSVVTLSPASITSGSSTTITLQAKDAYGNKETTGGQTLVFSLGSASGAQGTFSAVTDNGNGTYTVTFTGTIAGKNTIKVTKGSDGGSEGGGGSSPAGPSVAPTIVVTPGPVSLATSLVSLSLSSVQVGATTKVTLQAKDAAGNNLTTGGLTVLFLLESTSGALGTFTPVTDNHNGTYTAIFRGTIAGTNTIEAEIGGQDVTSTGPTITVL